MTTMAPLVVVGDTLLDRDVEGTAERLSREGPSLIVDDPVERERPGGAGLAALLAATSDRPVVLISALSTDGAGHRLRRRLADGGVHLVDLGLDGPTPEKVRIRAGGRLLLKVDRGARRPAPVGDATPAAVVALGRAAAVLVSDYGGTTTRSPRLRAELARIASRVLWDPHPRCQPPVAGILLATPNVHEAAHFSGQETADEPAVLVSQGRVLAERWRAAAVVITRAERGALLVAASGSVTSLAAEAVRGDACGAGDSFAAATALAIASGASVAEAAGAGVRSAARFVAAGGVAALPPTGSAAMPPEVIDLPAIARVRAAGGTVVASGGCFDILHAGHVAVLREARALGDCLVVCLNSDESVRRLKGPGRPVVPQADRAAVLRALACVDEVVIFDEPTPEAVLERLRPDIWAKGGDHSLEELAEAPLVRSWGGQVVTLPYVPGRSTSRLLEQAGPPGL